MLLCVPLTPGLAFCLGTSLAVVMGAFNKAAFLVPDSASLPAGSLEMGSVVMEGRGAVQVPAMIAPSPPRAPGPVAGR